MTAIAESVFPSRDTLPVCLFENPNRLVGLKAVLEFYARHFIGLRDELQLAAFQMSAGACSAQAQEQFFTDTLPKLREHCLALELTLSVDQIDRINSLGRITQRTMTGYLLELQQRIDDEMSGRAFYIIPTDRRGFYQVEDIEVEPLKRFRMVRLKDAAEVFGERAVARFPAAYDDLQESCKCFVFRRNKACVFHLMRVIEVAVVKLAKLIGLQDPKPSWGAILGKLEQVVLRTKYQDRSPGINQHLAFLEQVLPEMQSVQRSWRNRVSHVEDRILPIGEYTDETTGKIMDAVRVFIDHLAVDLPDGL